MRSQVGDLFIQPPMFKKEAGFKMPPNSDLWSESVFQVFSEQFPDLAEMSGGDVDWDQSKINEESGFAVGNIIVNNGDSSIRIPIVIKDFFLQPIDIFEYDGKMHLLNSENIGAAMKENDSIGKVSLPVNTKFVSGKFNQWLTKGATEESWRTKITNFEKVAKKLGSVYVDRPLNVLKNLKVDSKKDNLAVYLKKSASKVGSVDVTYYQDGKVVKVGEISPADRKSIVEREIKEAFDVVFDTGSAICKLGETVRADVGFVGVNVTEGLESIDDVGTYESEEITNGGIVNANVLSIFISPLGYDGKKDNLKKLFIVEGKDGFNYSTQGVVIGKPIDGNSINFGGAIIPLASAERYDKGVLIYSDNDDLDTCSEIITIDRVEATPSGKVRIFLKTDAGTIHYLINDDFKRVLQLSGSDPLFSGNSVLNLTGPNLPLFKLNKPVELVSTLDNHQMIYNGTVMGAAKDGKEMTVRSEDGKIAGKFDGVDFYDDQEQFMARMISVGVGPEKTAALLQYFSYNESPNPISIVGIKTATNEEKLLDRDNAGKIAAMVRGMREDLIKAAAAIEASGGKEDESAAILGVGLIDEENIRHFVQIIPNLEDSADLLAKMLYSIRVGNLKVDEGAVKSALLNITKIIGRLREVSSRI